MLLPDGVNSVRIHHCQQLQKVSGVFGWRLHIRGEIHAKAGSACSQVFNRNHPENFATQFHTFRASKGVSVCAKNVHTNCRPRIDALQKRSSRRIVRVYMPKQKIRSQGLRNFVERAHQEVDVVERP
jgi:hypothetical protein